MTTNTDIVNRALQLIGTRTSVTDAELAGDLSNEAIQANIALVPLRRRLLRMAPWSCGLKTANLTYITSVPGTPENTSPATTLWQPGQPTPPWSYEYQYPVDCLRTGWVIPTTQTGYAGGVPITSAVTGGAASWSGPPVKFQVQSDTFVPVTGAAPVAGGTGYTVGDIITLAQSAQGLAPVGAPAQLIVTGAVGTAVTGVDVVNQIAGSAAPLGGSYFTQQPNPVPQGSTTGSGLGATFNLTYGPAGPQRVILTNQEFAIMVYVQDITNPNSMDDMFQEAWVKVVAATLSSALANDKKQANMLIQEANGMIQLARVGDGNEGLTVNDVTPDWIRTRGVDWAAPYSDPYNGFDWGGLFPAYG